MVVRVEIIPTVTVFLIIFALVLLMVILRNQLVMGIIQENFQPAGNDEHFKRRWKIAFAFGLTFFVGVSILITLITLGLIISMATQDGKNFGDILQNFFGIFPLFLSLIGLLIAPLAPVSLIVILGTYYRFSLEVDT